MATRYIGDAVIRIQYRDRGDYAGSICVPGRASGRRRYCWNFSDLRAAAVGFGRGVAYDSPRAYDVMAASAAAFGAHEDGTIANEVEGWQRADGTYEIRRSPGGPAVDARLVRNPRPRGIEHDTAIVLKRVRELGRPFSNADYQFYAPHRSVLTIQTLERRGYIRSIGRGRYEFTVASDTFIQETLGSRHNNPVISTVNTFLQR